MNDTATLSKGIKYFIVALNIFSIFFYIFW